MHLCYYTQVHGVCQQNFAIFLPNSFLQAKTAVKQLYFTAGVGENDKATRKKVCEYLGYLGVKIDDAANDVRGKRTVISAPDSKVKVMLIPTNEELAIARETLRLVK